MTLGSMRKLLHGTILASVFGLVSCSPSPAELAAESHSLHAQLEKATNRNDSATIFKQIAALETRAREIFTKDELKEYERLAHDTQ